MKRKIQLTIHNHLSFINYRFLVLEEHSKNGNICSKQSFEMILLSCLKFKWLKFMSFICPPACQFFFFLSNIYNGLFEKERKNDRPIFAFLEQNFKNSAFQWWISVERYCRKLMKNIFFSLSFALSRDCLSVSPSASHDINPAVCSRFLAVCSADICIR